MFKYTSPMISYNSVVFYCLVLFSIVVFYCLVCKGIKLSVLEKLYIKYIPFDNVHEHRWSAHACLKV